MAIKTYRVRDGKTFGPAGMYKAGHILELDEADARRFLDKLQATDELQAVSNPPVISPLKNDLNVEVPEDLKLIPDDEPAFKIDAIALEGDKPVPVKKKPGRKKKES